MSCAGTSLCLGRGVCRGRGSQASGLPVRSGACGLHSHHPCCSASEHCCCLLIMLIIENYRFSVGNVYLHPTFPKLPISIAVMSHPPARFRQRWPFLPVGSLLLWGGLAAWATRGDGQLPPGTVLAHALRVPQSPQGRCSDAGSACALYPSWVPPPTASCLGSACSTAQESRGQRWVSPCTQVVVDGAEQRDREGC